MLQGKEIPPPPRSAGVTQAHSAQRTDAFSAVLETSFKMAKVVFHIVVHCLKTQPVDALG
jgi:hypothetical protein